MNAPELTTVADDEAVVHMGATARRYVGLAPDREHAYDGLAFRTLPALGERLACFATVNDVHFGETRCGVIQGSDIGPVFESGPGEAPYPETMNRAAAEEIAAIAPGAVVAKGDLTASGSAPEYRAFLDCWGRFGDRLHHVRGNHDAYHGEAFLPPAPLEVALEGVRLAVLDTTWPGHAGGRIPPRDLEWLDALAAGSDRPVLVLGHHPLDGLEPRADGRESFGLQPASGRALVEVFARRPSLRGYFAGHTHRNRVQHVAETAAPFVEVACVKDYPGTWAEYRVFEQGVLQVHRRISTPEALAWSERTRAMYAGAYAGYALGGLEERCFAIRW